MKLNISVKIGIVGSIISGLFCFTPILINILIKIGFTEQALMVDYIVFPMLFFFLLLIYLGLMKQFNDSSKE